jgi:catechol 2,3-dioxygenase-like lactoylglutathione lyase family enzyme
MPRLDHAAFETDDPDSTAAFYERIFGACVVKAEDTYQASNETLGGRVRSAGYSSAIGPRS